jgi:DNA-binding NarL/FixJ family response regulator
MKILVVDDHMVVRQGLKLILAREFTQAVFVEAENAQEALEQVGQTPFDLLVLDINMPGRSGLDAVSDLKKAAPKLRILALSMYAEEQFAPRALRAGVNGCITKDTAAKELLDAVRKVLAGGTYVSTTLAEKRASALQTDGAPALHETLSKIQPGIPTLRSSLGRRGWPADSQRKAEE